MRSQGRNLEKKVVRGSKTVGRDVKKGLSRAGAKLRRGAETVGRDVERAGKRAGNATRRGMTRADDRVRPNRRT